LVEFAILGPLEARAEGGPISLGGPKQRALLAVLLLEAGRVVSLDHLVDALWAGEPPATAVASLQNFVAQLRKALGPDVIETRQPGYLVRLGPEQLDVARVRALVDEARATEPVRRAVLPAAMRGHPAAQALSRQHCAITWLAPGERDAALPGVAVAAPAPASKHANDASLWITVDLDGTRALLPGDAEAPGIAAALAAGIAAPADVLVLPHHGRRDPAIETLVATVRPRLCLCSNRSGEGESAQGRALQPHGVPTFATGDCGDLVLIGGRSPRLCADRGLPLPETLALPAPAR